MELKKVTRKQINSKECFICGIDNDAGLKMRFYETEDNCVVGRFVARDVHQSYPGRLHGGIASTVLDEILGRTIQLYEPEAWAVTADMSVKYKKPIPLNAELRAVARPTKYVHGLLFAEGEITDMDGNVLATASGRYMKLSLNRIVGETGAVADEHTNFILDEENDPEYI